MIYLERVQRVADAIAKARVDAGKGDDGTLLAMTNAAIAASDATLEVTDEMVEELGKAIGFTDPFTFDHSSYFVIRGWLKEALKVMR